MTEGYRDGIDLILGQYDETKKFVPLGHSDTCKISHKAETGTRQVKPNTVPDTADAAAALVKGKWDEKYVKKNSTTITAEGFVYKGDTFGYPELEEMFINCKPLVGRWGYVDEIGLTTSPKYHEGTFIITSLDDEGKAGDDEKWSLTIENSGAVTKVTAA